MKDEILYSEKYCKPGIKHLVAPRFNSEEMECVEAFTLEAGKVKHNGREMEYQIIKVYFDEKS